MMKKSLLLLTIAAMLLPMSMMAQTLVLDKESGLEYLDNGDGRLYIDVGGTPITTINGTPSNQYFVSDGGLRSNWRQNIPDERLQNKAKWYKEYLDEITTLDIGNNGPTTFKGIEYFRNITSITVKQTGYNGNQLDLDLSKNTQLTSLAFATPATAQLSSINISNTQLTSLTLPSGSNSYLKTLTAENSGLTSLDISNCTALTSVSLTNSADLTTLTLPTEKTKLARLVIRGCASLPFSPSNPLDLREYTKINEFTVDAGSTFVVGAADDPNASVWVDNNTGVEELEIYANGREFDFSKYTILKKLICHDAAKVDVSGNELLETLIIDGMDYDTELVLSKDNTALTKLDICYSGITRLDLSGEGSADHPELSLAPNLVTFRAFCGKLEDLNLSWHTSLKAAPYPSKDLTIDFNKAEGLCLIPIPKSLASRNLANTIEDVDEYNANNKLRWVTLKGCTSLDKLSLSFGTDGDNDSWIYFNDIDSVDVSDCINLREFHCYNSMLTKLNMEGCTNLWKISIDQGLLTGINDINVKNCPNLNTFIAKRQKWESLDFLLKPSTDGGNRELAELEAMNQIQVNGGSYTLKTVDGVSYIRPDKDGNEMKVTCRLRSIDLSHLTPWNGKTDATRKGLQKLLIECNMLTELDLSVVGSDIQELACSNNMLTTLDLTPLNGNTRLNLRSCNWKYQVGYLSAEVVKGHWDGSKNTWMEFLDDEGNPDANKESKESGKYDWVALHMVNGGYTHRMDNDFGLYTNLYDARYENPDGTIGRDTIAKEATPWMCKVPEVNTIVTKGLEGADKFLGTYPCPTGHTGQHIFLHSQEEIKNDKKFGPFKDQDLTGTVLTYKFNTGFKQTRKENDISPDDSDNYSLDGLKNLSAIQQDSAHIVVRMHLFPHLLNINPVSKNEFSAVKLNEHGLDNVTYFSSTLCLDYDALIPKGVTCYTISGKEENDSTVFIVRGTALDGQLTMEPFGGENAPSNWILPANTPVYVRADSPNPAGLYAFQPIREVKLLGWENLRGEKEQDDFILHGIDNLNGGDLKPGYEQPLRDAERLLQEEPHKSNLLRGWIPKKYDVDINHENHNRIEGDKTLSVQRDSVLTLGIQNRHSIWPVIGFWPYYGSGIEPNRCYIKCSDIYKEGVPPSGAKGFNFFFVGEEKRGIDIVTGIQDLNVDVEVKVKKGWYNMQGVRLNSEPTRQGVYIFNGKKVTIKK